MPESPWSVSSAGDERPLLRLPGFSRSEKDDTIAPFLDPT